MLGRREVLGSGAALALGAMTFGSARAAVAPDDASTVKRYRALGSTGIEVPDISFGTGTTADPELMRYAFQRGVTYFDTADGYPLGKPGEAEKALGEALRGHRKQVTLATKTLSVAGTTRAEYMQRLEASLKRLETDYVDVYFNHGVNDVELITSPEWKAFTDQAKQQGKIRFCGMSGHGGRLADCLDAAFDAKAVDVILVAYNFGQEPRLHESLTKGLDMIARQPRLPEQIKRAHGSGIGVMVMKTLMGAKLNDMRPFERPDGTFAQAAFRWVLSNPDVDGLVITMNERAEVDEYLAASGGAEVRPQDQALLDRYLERNGASYCRPGCDACETACARGVQVGDVLRSRMYAVDYGAFGAGLATYAGIERDASACATCTTPTCLPACPHDVDVRSLTRETAMLFRGA
jgi:predicted aldo/keto reductase-like oxidoreductase